jgi:hypothetical protein
LDRCVGGSTVSYRSKWHAEQNILGTRMFALALTRILMACVVSASCVTWALAQTDESAFTAKRNSYPFWNSSAKRDILGFKPGMTLLEVRRRMPSCAIFSYIFLCAASSDEYFQLSLTEHARPLMVKDVAYVLPASGAALDTLVNDVEAQFGLGAPRQCDHPPEGLAKCLQWALEDGAFVRLAEGISPQGLQWPVAAPATVLYLSTPKWIADLEAEAVEAQKQAEMRSLENEQKSIRPRKH